MINKPDSPLPSRYSVQKIGTTSVVTLSILDLAGQCMAEHDGAGAVLREYIWLGERPLAVVEGGQLYHLHWDHILRPVLATNATGTVVWAARYLPCRAASTRCWPTPARSPRTSASPASGSSDARRMLARTDRHASDGAD